MNEVINPTPFLKWVGGKRQLLPELKKYVPEFNRYYEPMIGAGALLFELQPKVAVINDINYELLNCYQVIKDYPQKLLDELTWFHNTEEHFYDVREWDRRKNDPLDTFMNPIIKACRTIYLNKTCFNGIYRVNSKGKFNVPYGHYKTEFKPDKETILAVSRYLNENQVTILSGDFETAVQDATKGDFVYFDPPYDPVSKTANFTAYDKSGFNKDDQIRLMRLCKELRERGVKAMVSNAYTPFILDLYQGFNIHEVQARRNVNSDGDKRGLVSEVIITNY